MFAVLYLADFALQAVLRQEPEAGKRAAALFTEHTKKSLAIAANAAACATGVELGMTAPQAVARCPTLLIRIPNAAAEAEARAALLAVGFTVSPTIENTAPGVCTIDLKGSAPAQYSRAAAAAVAQLQAFGLDATAGIAATPLLALYAARKVGRVIPNALPQDDRTVPDRRIQDNPPSPTNAANVGRDLPIPPSRIASDSSTPCSTELPLAMAGYGVSSAGSAKEEDPALYPTPAHTRDRALNRTRADNAAPPQTSDSSTIKSTSRRTSNCPDTDPRDMAPRVLLVDDTSAFLAPLPLAAADPSPEIAGVLASWGLRTFGELTALARDDIGRRLGPDGLALWDRAQGGTTRPLHPVAPPQTFSAARDFEDEIETLEPLLFSLRRFLERLTLELRTSGYVAAALDLTLTLANDTQHERSFRLPEPTADLEILFRTLHTHLDSVRTDSAIRAVALRATPTRPLVRQQGLFDTGLRDPHGFSETLARVVAIVGSDRVGTPRHEDTHRPDAVKLVPPAPVIPPPAETPIHPAIGLPLRRFRPPLPAQLELTDGKPTYVWSDHVCGAIAAIRGPWVSSGEWWQADRAWRRTEYDIALAQGGLYRLVFSAGTWAIEGEYD